MRGSKTVFAAALCSVAAIGATTVCGTGVGAAASSITAPAPPTNPRHDAVKSPGHDDLGDYNVGATIGFSIPPGQRVEVASPSNPSYSQCVSSAQRLSFDAGPAPDYHSISMDADDGHWYDPSSCHYKYSYNGWKITVNGTFIGNVYLSQRPVSGRNYDVGCSVVKGYTCQFEGPRKVTIVVNSGLEKTGRHTR
jgi:hypothetical protein